MTTNSIRIHPTPDAARLPQLNTEELRDSYVVGDLFKPDAIELVYTHMDRAVIGGMVPVRTRLQLEAPLALRASCFTERRELGVLNLGGEGSIFVDGERHRMAGRDALYIGRGMHQVEFESVAQDEPARFYLVSHLAHRVHPTRHASFSAAESVQLGSPRDANRRTVYKYIHEGGIPSCQLVMGFTLLDEGSVWNTMPTHRHPLRSEIYLYFGVAPDAWVLHLMGAPNSTRHLMVRNEQAVLSPPWSIHSGVGTRSYGFAWAMGGENQEFADMDGVATAELH